MIVLNDFAATTNDVSMVVSSLLEYIYSSNLWPDEDILGLFPEGKRN